ncbi:SHOCT domain-containing protein [Xanthomonas translucens pv. undulosa]|uniref:SHOCT domain-containing protein n=1 Tax=Xanthomonas campestris pv. translucens TaxID=343 RepID=UPI00071E80A1|nr:SHOCT domain-containing protein [Xanthomonas translucens]
MFGFSIWHLVIMSVLLALPVLVFALVWLAMRADRRAQASRRAAAPPPLPAASAEMRLRALEALRAQGLVDQAEYERRRQQILAEV